MIEVTNEAYTKLIQKAALEDNFSFRLGVTGGGCGGMEYLLLLASSTYSR